MSEFYDKALEYALEFIFLLLTSIMGLVGYFVNRFHSRLKDLEKKQDKDHDEIAENKKNIEVLQTQVDAIKTTGEDTNKNVRQLVNHFLNNSSNNNSKN